MLLKGSSDLRVDRRKEEMVYKKHTAKPYDDGFQISGT